MKEANSEDLKIEIYHKILKMIKPYEEQGAGIYRDAIKGVIFAAQKLKQNYTKTGFKFNNSKSGKDAGIYKNPENINKI